MSRGGAPAGRRAPPLPGTGRGPVRVLASGFTVADDDALEGRSASWNAAASRSGASRRRGRALAPGPVRIAFDDPFGNRLELVTQQECLARPVAFGRASGITEFGHLCLDAPDVHEAYRFWSGTFNAKVSDWIGDAACPCGSTPCTTSSPSSRATGRGCAT